MQHEPTPPFRFRPPRGWPTPSDEWTDLYQGAEPTPGWTPGPGVAPAPPTWAFWRSEARSFWSYMPDGSRRLRLVQRVAAPVLFASVVAVIVLTGLGAVVAAALVLVPLVAAIAVVLVTGVRHAELAARTAASIRQDAAAWRRTELPARARAARPDLGEDDAVAAWNAAAWGLPAAHPFDEAKAANTDASFRRTTRRALTTVSVVSAFVLVVATAAVVAPVVDQVQHDGSTLAVGLQDIDPDTGEPYPDDPGDDQSANEGDSAPWTSDDGTISAALLQDDDAYETACGTVDSVDGCWAWAVTGECSGPAEVTIGFADEQDGDDVRTDVRTVTLTAGRPLVLVETGGEQWAGVDDVTCHAHPDPAAELRSTALDSDDEDADGAWPDGCADLGCAGWELTTLADCESATVQMAVDEPIGDLGHHDLVVATPLWRGETTDVWAGGAWSSDHDARLTSVTCR